MALPRRGPIARFTRRALPGLFLLLAPASARAQTDLLIVPFIGIKFGGHTSIAIGEPTVGQKKLTFGASTLILTDQLLGIEADIEQTPQFFGPGLRRPPRRIHVFGARRGRGLCTAPDSSTHHPDVSQPYRYGRSASHHEHRLVGDTPRPGTD